MLRATAAINDLILPGVLIAGVSVRVADLLIRSVGPVRRKGGLAILAVGGVL